MQLEFDAATAFDVPVDDDAVVASGRRTSNPAVWFE